MKEKILITTLSITALITASIVLYGYVILYKTDKKTKINENTNINISENVQQQEQGENTQPQEQEEVVQPQQQKQGEGVQQQKKESGIVNIAFFGLDTSNPDEASRSDTIMIVSIDNKDNEVKVTSLMRDMYVRIPGKNENRINAAYAFGGPQLALKTINSDFDLDIKNYVKVDFSGMEKLVDKLGGVEIDVKADEAPSCYVSKPGMQTLNGSQALAYSRIRHVGNADYERTERQRKVLNVLFKKIKSQGIFKIPGIISTILPYVKTNLPSADILKLTLQAVKFNAENIKQYRLPVDGYFKSRKIRGMDVLVPDMDKNTELLHAFIYGTQ